MIDFNKLRSSFYADYLLKKMKRRKKKDIKHNSANGKNNEDDWILIMELRNGKF